MIVAFIIALVFFSFLLIKSADHVVIAIRRLTHNAQSGVFTLSVILLALATSFPELSVAITSALEATPTLSFGNIVGSNIANISLVVGLAAVIVGKVNVHGDFLRRDVAIAFIAGILPLALALDGGLSRVDGLILLSLYGAYSTSLFKLRFSEVAESHRVERFVHKFFREINHVNGQKTKEAGRLFIGLAVLLFSASMIVRFAKELAIAANIPVFLVGLVLLSIGTTLPELAFSIRSLKDKEPTMFFGNILGSIIGNSTLIIGIAALIYPVEIVTIKENIIAGVAFILIFAIFWIFIKTKFTLSRLEASFLILLYIVFVVFEFLL